MGTANHLRRACGMATLGLLLAAQAGVAAETTDTTIMEFPADQVVGSYLLVKPGTTWQEVEANRSLAQQFQPARGRVTVANDERLVLGLTGQRSNGRSPSMASLNQLHESQLLTISFASSRLLPADLEQLKRHKQLKVVSTQLCKLDDEGLATICRGVGQLERLSIPETKITNAGVANLAKLSQLEKLSLYGTAITEASLVHLKELTKLRQLNLGLTRTRGNGLHHLKNLTELRELVLWKTNTRNEDLVHLQPLRNLERLDLKESNVSDAGLKSLTSLNKLKQLDLSYNRISDAGLSHLASLSQLETLLLHGTNVTEAGVQELKAAVPGVNVVLADPYNLKALGAEAIREGAVKNRRQLDRYFKSWE